MSNERIAERLLEVVDRVLSRSLPSSAFANAVDVHAPAFEGVSRTWLDRLHRLSVQVIEEDASSLEEDVLGLQGSTKSLQEAASMLRSLCSAQPDAPADAPPKGIAPLS